MTPYDYQEKIAEEALSILRDYGLVYLAMEERTGKTLTSIRVAEKSLATNILVITKKKAIEGWENTFNLYNVKDTKFTVINYHGIHKKEGKSYKLKYKPSDYDMVILDESHSYLSAYPKVGTIWKSVAKLCEKKPIIFMSATPSAQGYQLLFNQFKLSTWTPLKYQNFYRFFEVYGIPDKIRTAYGLQETYRKCSRGVWDKVKHLFITYTREDLGFEHEPEDIVHYVELAKDTKDIYNYAMENLLLEVKGLMTPLDSSMKLRTTLHMLEGGVAKIDDDYIQLDNDEKIQAILKDFGDTENLVIMYHYKAELTKLSKYFKKATLSQATSNAEGVDYSMYKYMVIYSQDFSTARHSQRRARQANKKRLTPIKVHFYLVKGGISEQVYKTVAINKENFVDSVFNKELL